MRERRYAFKTLRTWKWLSFFTNIWKGPPEYSLPANPLWSFPGTCLPVKQNRNGSCCPLYHMQLLSPALKDPNPTPSPNPEQLLPILSRSSPRSPLLHVVFIQVPLVEMFLFPKYPNPTCPSFQVYVSLAPSLMGTLLQSPLTVPVQAGHHSIAS